MHVTSFLTCGFDLDGEGTTDEVVLLLWGRLTRRRDYGGRWRCSFSLSIGLSCEPRRELSIPSIKGIVPEELLARFDCTFSDKSNPELPPYISWLHQSEVWMTRVVDVPPYTIDSREGIKDNLLLVPYLRTIKPYNIV